ncbi:MAG: hypothetical protein HGN29_09015 [Asgard group archaeon]|nr:hypothetical protein [Asgard group archaeon]
MKRGFGYILCIIITLSIFVGVFTITTSVNAYQGLIVDDQLLYKSDFTVYWDIDESYWYETEVFPDYVSYKTFDHYELNATEYHSFRTTLPSSTYVDGRYTWSYYDNYRNDIHRNYTYNYPGSYWEVDTTSTFNQLSTGSDSYLSYADVYDGILNFDFSTYFDFTSYSHSTSKFYTVNGISSLHSIDVYTYYQDSNLQTPYDYYNISYLENNDYGYEIVYYVDATTGFLLEYYFLYYDFFNSYFFDYSTDLGMNVEYYFTDYYVMTENWTLFESTAAYTPVLDADIPCLDIDYGFNYDIIPSDFLSIYFDLEDSSSSMTLEIYLNEVFIDGFSGLTNGYYSYDLDIKSIMMNDQGHELKFVLYDDNNYNHNSTWYMFLNDIRHEWPVIVELTGIYNYEIGTVVTNVWKLLDNDPNYFEMKFDGMIVDYGFNYDHMYIYYTFDGNITAPGDYILSIFANDMSGHTTYLEIIVHVYENGSLDSVAPEIDGLIGTIHIKKGDSAELNWFLSDENLSFYEIYLNGTIIDEEYFLNETKEVSYNLSSLDIGAYFFEIYAYDSYGNIAVVDVTVIVEEAEVNPADPNEPTEPSNTITLDAPQVLYVAIGIISLLALTYTIRKRR